MSPLARRIVENLARVREQIAAAELRGGRQPGSVTLVAVTKYVGPAEAEALVAAGCHDLGESRPQELWRKAEALAGLPVRWHLVGHLQRNKIRRTLPHVTLLHSADSERLLADLDSISRDLGRKTSVLLEVNISGESAKHGLTPHELDCATGSASALGARVAEFKHLEIRGLMAMAGLAGGRDGAKADFVNLRALRDRLRTSFPPEITLAELSMGMSDDFDLAIEAGATIVRIGSALFEGVTP